MLHVARCKCRTQKSRQKSPSGHYPTTLSGYIVSLVWGTPGNFNGFRVSAALLHGTLVVGRQPNCGVEQRASPTFDRAAIKLGSGPYF